MLINGFSCEVSIVITAKLSKNMVMHRLRGVECHLVMREGIWSSLDIWIVFCVLCYFKCWFFKTMRTDFLIKVSFPKMA